jgi:hypothetical protein
MMTNTSTFPGRGGHPGSQQQSYPPYVQQQQQQHQQDPRGAKFHEMSEEVRRREMRGSVTPASGGAIGHAPPPHLQNMHQQQYNRQQEQRQADQPHAFSGKTQVMPG